MSVTVPNANNLVDVKSKNIMISHIIDETSEPSPQLSSMELLEPHLLQVLFLAVWLECLLYVRF